MVKGFLDPVTASKIHVLGKGYKKELLAQVPPENLPVHFGGTCECPGGCELSDAGPWTEPEYRRPAWWEKPDSTIENKGSDAVATGEGATEVPVAVGEEAKAPAPAAA
jgi:hypothetical protein